MRQITHLEEFHYWSNQAFLADKILTDARNGRSVPEFQLRHAARIAKRAAANISGMLPGFVGTDGTESFTNLYP